MINRRIVLIGLASVPIARPLATRAQQQALPEVGYLASYSRDASGQQRLAGFEKGLAEAGYVEGRNVAIEVRWADGHYDRLPALAADLVRLQVKVIVAASTPAALAAKAATTTIPVVFSLSSDPVALGLVSSLARPGGNLTGVTRLNVELGPKRLQLMHEIVPAATSLALLVNPTNQPFPRLNEEWSRRRP